MASEPRQVWTFFYGSYLNFDVLREVELVPTRWHTARLDDWSLSIRPLANIAPAAGDSVYGIVATATHAELERLYQHAEHILGGVYLPEAVLVHTEKESLPALTYVGCDMEPAAAKADYVERILGPCRSYGFPEAYLRQIESFR